jgi:hypothetical protein
MRPMTPMRGVGSAATRASAAAVPSGIAATGAGSTALCTCTTAAFGSKCAICACDITTIRSADGSRRRSSQ